MTKGNDMKAIETIWKGYRFRSRTEARWAVFLEAAGVTFDYEPEGVILPSGPYLPDFRFELNYDFTDLEGERRHVVHSFWLEIKGQTPTDEEQRKCWELAVAGDGHVLLAVSSPDVRPQIYSFSGGVDFEDTALLQRYNGLGHFAACSQRGGICLSFTDGKNFVDPEDGEVYPPSTQTWLGYPKASDDYPRCDGRWKPTISPVLQRAYDAARSARFEFGQTDPRWPT